MTALAAFAFSRPVLDSFGRSPETFIARQATPTDIVVFGLAVAFLPALVVAAVGAATRVFGDTVRQRSHVGLVALVGGVGAWRMGRDLTGRSNGATQLVLAGLAVGLLLGLLRWRVPATATFLRYAGVASVVFLLQFLVMSPTTDLAFGGPGGVDDEVERQIADDLGDDPPSVVLVVLDALPTAALLDGTGRVDAELYPDLAALASTSTWYRNNTTVAAFTNQAVPALLSGRYPEPNEPPPGAESENLFTLLGDSYDLHVKEQVTKLCPDSMCARPAAGAVDTLLGDAVRWWRSGDSESAQRDFDLPAALGDDRYAAAEAWIDDLHVPSGGRPDLTFLHIVLPHEPWRFTETGAVYDGSEPPAALSGLGWSDTGHEVGLQRFVLQAQAADRLVGRLMDRLREDGVFDDSLVVLTADHGAAFLPGSGVRVVYPDNIPYILWTPLFVKAPGQSEPTVDDGNVMSVDVVPTIADRLGVDLPWDVDGVPVPESGPDRDPNRKLFADNGINAVRAEEGEDLVEIDGSDHFAEALAADPVAATGPDAVWKRTVHGDLFGRRVDDLRVGEPAGTELEVDEPGDLDDIDTSAPLPLEIVGHVDLPVGTHVALALNGTVGATTTVGRWPVGGGWLVQGLMPPGLFVDGENELTTYVVDGSPGDETLHPLDVEAPAR